MKTFSQFTNEGVSDYLRPKSREEMKKVVNQEREESRRNLNIDDMTTYDELMLTILKYQMDFNLLRKSRNGRHIYNGNLHLSREMMFGKLPDNLTVFGDLDISHNFMEELPKGLEVHGYLNCSYNDIKEIPYDIIVHNLFNCSNNNISMIPNGFKTYGSLNISDNLISKLPDKLTVSGFFSCQRNKLTTVNLNKMEVSANIFLDDNEIIKLLPSSDIFVYGALGVQDNKLTKLPDNMNIAGDLYCGYNLLTKLPKGLRVDGGVYAEGNLVDLKRPEDSRIGNVFFYKSSYDKTNEGVNDFLIPKDSNDIKSKINDMDIYDKIYSISSTNGLEKVVRYPTIKQLYKVIGRPYNDYIEIYDSIINNEKVKYGKSRMDDVDYFKTYKYMFDLIMNALHSDRKIYEFCDNQHVALWYSYVLELMELEFLFRDIFKEKRFYILANVKNIIGRWLELDKYIANAVIYPKIREKFKNKNDIHNTLGKWITHYTTYTQNWKIEEKYIKTYN